ncbi:hypothetical protein [Teichococcus vastitatis]|uniref:hypothetical protein n=1 Tax=Teichococcus vastitatis TaxID=2307076 RepID=UPI0013003A7F|nr:hypothetical protein [Pseudoroseomonas vastitatis]
MLPVLMLSHPPDEAWQRWLVDFVLIGALGAALMAPRRLGRSQAAGLRRAAQGRREHCLPGIHGRLLDFTLGGAKLIGADAFMSVFQAGLVFNLSAP